MITTFDPLVVVKQIDFEKMKDHPNILIAARFWEDERYQAAKTCYKFMRMIDDMIDDRKSSGQPLSEMEKECFTLNVKEWLQCLKQSSSADPFVKELFETIERFKIPVELFNKFSASMIYDINFNGFNTFQDFLNYSEGASVTPASVFVHLCLLNKIGNEYFPSNFNAVEIARPCAIFSYLVHIIRDFQKDQLNHLNYFAMDVIEKCGIKLSDLYEIAKGRELSPSFRLMMSKYREFADDYRVQTEQVLGSLQGKIDDQYYLSLEIIYNLYLQVFERIDVENGSFTSKELNPTPEENKARTLSTIKRCFEEEKMDNDPSNR